MSARFLHRPLNVACSADEDGPDQGDGDVAVAPAKPKLKRPPLYRVILLNDDYTPMEFVVQVLEQFFGMNREKATQYIRRILLKRRRHRSTSQPERADIRYCVKWNPPLTMRIS